MIEVNILINYCQFPADKSQRIKKVSRTRTTRETTPDPPHGHWYHPDRFVITGWYGIHWNHLMFALRGACPGIWQEKEEVCCSPGSDWGTAHHHQGETVLLPAMREPLLCWWAILSRHPDWFTGHWYISLPLCHDAPKPGSPGHWYHGNCRKPDYLETLHQTAVSWNTGYGGLWHEAPVIRCAAFGHCSAIRWIRQRRSRGHHRGMRVPFPQQGDDRFHQEEQVKREMFFVQQGHFSYNYMQ